MVGVAVLVTDTKGPIIGPLVPIAVANGLVTRAVVSMIGASSLVNRDIALMAFADRWS